MNISSAARSPSPGTACVRNLWRSQSVQTRTRRSISSRASRSSAVWGGRSARDGRPVGEAWDAERPDEPSAGPARSSGRRKTKPAPASVRKSTWALRSSRISAALFFKQSLDAVENDAAQLPLAEEARVLDRPGQADELRGVRVGPEPQAFAHGVGDHEVGALRSHLRPGVGHEVVSLCGEADEELTRLFSPAEQG